MKRILLLVLALLSTLSFQTSSLAQGTAFTYQGRLNDGDGPANGTFDFRFTVRDALTGGSPVGVNPLSATLVVSNGLFTVTLDPGAGVFTGADRWLHIAVRTNGAGAFTTLAPRQKIAAAPYAVYAGGASAAGISGTLSAAQVPNLDASKITSGTLDAVRIPNNESPANVIPVGGMVWIKPGQFIIGSRADEPGRVSDEGPQTVVTLTKGFWMGVHEVTQGEYLKVVGSNPSFFTPDNGYTADTNRPVETVSWNGATNYCRRLTTAERSAGRIPTGWGYRLPTEAEWEYACRAGARTTRFSYGDDLSGTALGNYAWYSANAANTTHPVEQRLANPWGLMDMHGNVFEWCQDYYGAYPGGSVTDPQGPVSGIVRVSRGGSWFDSAGGCRSADRIITDPGDAGNRVGFRVVLSPGQP